MIESHQKVLDKPSNETVESTSSTKAVPLMGKSSDLSTPAHGILIEIIFELEEFLLLVGIK